MCRVAKQLAVLLCAWAWMCAADRAGRRRCGPIAGPVLSEILGPAYNARYMSIEEPAGVNGPSAPSASSQKRAPAADLSFYVDDEFSQELDDGPAWLADHTKARVHRAARMKRDSGIGRQWECRSRVRWIDLGPDYFPRYIRSVECLAETCWYDMLKCKPRSFTVKLLKRRHDRCASDGFRKTGTVGLPRELRELWVWEEHAVNFCCDCSM